MLESERPLLIAMALDAAGIGTNGELYLFCLKAAMSVMTARALHRPLHHLVMEWFAELRFGLGVA